MKILKKLPLQQNVETKAVLKKLTAANKALAELKGMLWNIPNNEILINTLALQEALYSTSLENLESTEHEVYLQKLFPENIISSIAKKVLQNFITIKKSYGLITNIGQLKQKHINAINADLIQTDEKNYHYAESTLALNTAGKPIINPSKHRATTKDLMSNLETYINKNSSYQLDLLIKTAIIHYQFYSIHPFSKDNERTGRIVTQLYLIMQNLLPLPVLYLSKYMNKFKYEYYKLLREVRTVEHWENYLLFMLDGIEQTALEAILKINKIQMLIAGFEGIIRQKYKFYSSELITNIFLNPYINIELIEKKLNISRITAAKYLNTLAKDGFLKKEQMGTANYYINSKLMQIIIEN
ncbi:MAG: addiction module protein [Flavobacteriales bacterium]|nr:MAG: addiction module protein [Flavobacteriales bacterium]